jgi:HAD superfamily hydrolase (TIGR01509 family)
MSVPRSGGSAGELPPLEAVLFDAGGTLVRLDFEWMSMAITQLGARIDVEALRRGEVEGRRRYDQSRGPKDAVSQPLGATGDIRAYLGGMLSAAGLPHYMIGPTIVRLLARDRTSGLWTRPVEGAKETLAAMVEMGLKCAVVSNSDGRAEALLARCGVLGGVEFVLDSHLEGVEKPDPRIFGAALERLGVGPERALFVGDIRSVDEVGARAAGMRFVLIDPYADYAPKEVAAIRSIEELPEFVSSRFTVPRVAARSGR